MKQALTILMLLTIVAAAFSAPVAAQSETKSYLIVARSNSLPKGLAKQVSAAGGTITDSIPEIGIAVAESNNANFAAQAASISGVRSVVPNLTLAWTDPAETVKGAAFGNPPSSGDDDFFFDLQWGHDAVDAPEAWDAGAQGAGARVAVLDGGFDLDHPDLVSNINFALSKDFTGEGLQYGFPDPFSHGTHVAGTIAAADNAFGTIGVAPQAELVLVKVLGDVGSGSFDDVIAGIVYAAGEADADVINMSLGATLPKHGIYDADGNRLAGANEIAELLVAIGRATTYAYQQGTTVIASAGNSGSDFDHNADVVHVPSDSPHAISISATAPIGWAVDPSTDLDVPAFYTNYGQSVIGFAAPGGSVEYPGNESCTVAGLTRPCWVFDLVFSTGNGGWYWSAGTSMAAPHAAGVAAIIVGQNGGDMHPAHVAAALRASADDLGKPGKDDFYGHGRVNAYNAAK